MNADSTDAAIEAAASPSEAVVMKIAERNEASPLKMPPLYEAVDPEALDSLFSGDRSGRVTFEYVGHEVTVNENGSISIQ